MRPLFESPADVMALWPTQKSFAEEIGVAETTANSWKARGSIPAPYWLTVTRAAQRRADLFLAVSLETLAEMAEREKCAPGEAA